MQKKVEILEGNISKGLIKLAIPIMATSFLEMAYVLIDMFWIGSLGSSAVAAVGTAGFFPWLMMGLILIPRVGAEVMVAQSIGKKEESEKLKYIATALQMCFVFGLLYSIGLYFLKDYLLLFFKIQEAEVVQMSSDYLAYLVLGLTFAFFNPVFTAIFNAHGQSKLPFYFNTTGLITNTILDPLLIFGGFGIAPMGVKGAALATALAQTVVSLCFIVFMIKNKKEFSGIPLFRLHFEKWKKVIILGVPAAAQSMVFTMISMGLARIITTWSAAAIAVQKVTAQIEAISWRSAQGFGTALTTYVGQNYGAGKYDRVKESYRSAIIWGGSIGIMAAILLLLFPQYLLMPFFHEPEVLEMGIQCMRIMGVCQMFMSTEIITAGAFNGVGKTIPSSVVGMVFTGLRIPLALWLSSYLGLDGVWWSMSISSILKGVILPSYFYRTVYRKL